MRRVHFAILILLVLGMLAGGGCYVLAARSKVSDAEARKLVEAYVRVVCEAYRRCDITLIDSVVGLNTKEGKNLTGLIGVRMDMGLSLDAQLLELKIAGVDQTPDVLNVKTRERWHYRDLKIGTGEQAGEDSTDQYELLYMFKKEDGKWMVSETRFVTDPQVGRKTTPWQATQQVLHPMGAAPSGPEKEKKP